MTSNPTRNIDPQYTWIAVFLPALLYFIYGCATGIHRVGGDVPYSRVGTSIRIHSDANCLADNDSGESNKRTAKCSVKMTAAYKVLSKTVFSLPSTANCDNRVELKYPVEIILQSSSQEKSSMELSYNFHSMGWVHDLEISRGYLLISDLSQNGKIWRWEVGGGPITIGRSLFMSNSGCRSSFIHDCNNETSHHNQSSGEENTLGGSGLAIHPEIKAEHTNAGRLVIAERGEGRIVRMEEDGARTPLVINVPSLCHSEQINRVHSPGLMLYSLFGDLIFTDEIGQGCMNNNNTSETVTGIYILKEASKIPALPVSLSRSAHKWTSTYSVDNKVNTDTYESMLEILYTEKLNHVSGMTMGQDLSTLYISGSIINDNHGAKTLNYVILKIPLEERDADVLDDTSTDESTRLCKQKKSNSNTTAENCQTPVLHPMGLLDGKATLVYDMTPYFKSSNGDSFDKNIGPSIAIDKHGNIYTSFPGGIAILNSEGDMLGTIPLHSDDIVGDKNIDDLGKIIPNSLLLGHDGYLYITTSTLLLRLRIKALPLDMRRDTTI